MSIKPQYCLFFLSIILQFFLAGYIFGDSKFSIRYDCNQISFKYAKDDKSLPDLKKLSLTEVDLSFSAQPIALSGLISLSSEIYQLNLRDLHLLAEVPMQYLKSLGYEGIVVFPDPKQIDPVSGVDLREGELGLTFLIWVSNLEDIEIQNAGIDPKVSDRVRSEIKSNPIGSELIGKPIMAESLKYWKRFGKNPSRNVQVVLSPSDTPGNVISVLKLLPVNKERFILQAANSGTESTGEWLIGGSYQNNQMSGNDDKLGITYFSSDTQEVQSFGISYEKPIIFPDFLMGGVSAGYSKYDASSFAVTHFNFKGDTKFIELNTKWNPLGTEFKKHSFSFIAGLRGEETTASNSLVSGRADAKLLIPKFSALFSTKGRYFQTETKATISANIRSINSESQTLLGGIQTESRYSRISINYLEFFQIGKWAKDKFGGELSDGMKDHILISRMQGGLALKNQRHLPQHQFITGGSGSVRGYPESPIAGDSGYVLSLEYRAPLPPIKIQEDLPDVKGTLVPFLDWGETFVNDPLYYEGDHSIMGAGVGLELKFPAGATARIDFAKPLREINNYGSILPGTRSSDNRVHAMLRWEF